MCKISNKTRRAVYLSGRSWPRPWWRPAARGRGVGFSTIGEKTLISRARCPLSSEFPASQSERVLTLAAHTKLATVYPSSPSASHPLPACILHLPRNPNAARATRNPRPRPLPSLGPSLTSSLSSPPPAAGHSRPTRSAGYNYFPALFFFSRANCEASHETDRVTINRFCASCSSVTPSAYACTSMCVRASTGNLGGLSFFFANEQGVVSDAVNIPDGLCAAGSYSVGLVTAVGVPRLRISPTQRARLADRRLLRRETRVSDKREWLRGVSFSGIIYFWDSITDVGQSAS